MSLTPRKTLGFFETPDALAQRLIGLSGIGPGETVLEPSAGLGRIAKQLLAKGVNVVAVEIDPTNAEALRQLGNGITVHCEPFEAFQVREAALFDAVIMNPPFANNLDMKHIRAAWEFVRPGRRLIAICSEGPFFRQDTAAREFRAWLEEIGADAVPLPANSFRESGTGVATRIIFCPKPEAAAPAADAAPPSAKSSTSRWIRSNPTPTSRARFSSRSPSANSPPRSGRTACYSPSPSGPRPRGGPLT